MKTSFLLPACFAATLFLHPAALRAADADPGPGVPADGSSAAPAGGAAARHAELLKRYDKNGDGKLDESEKAAAKADAQKNAGARKDKMHERALELYDKNGDGKLDEAELTAAIADLKNRPRVLKHFDKDGDGKLNAEEQAAFEKAIRDRIARHAKETAGAAK